jgi:hypothetical protein
MCNLIYISITCMGGCFLNRTQALIAAWSAFNKCIIQV